MRACGPVLPCSEGSIANPIRGATQARSRPGIEIGVTNPVARSAGSFAEVVEVSVSDGLARSAVSIGVKESGVADIGAGTELSKCHTRDKEEQKSK